MATHIVFKASSKLRMHFRSDGIAKRHYSSETYASNYAYLREIKAGIKFNSYQCFCGEGWCIGRPPKPTHKDPYTEEMMIELGQRAAWHLVRPWPLPNP